MKRYLLFYLLVLAASCTSCSNANKMDEIKQSPTPPVITNSVAPTSSVVPTEVKQLTSTSIPFQSETIVIEDLSKEAESSIIYLDDSVLYYAVETLVEEEYLMCHLLQLI